MATNKKFQERRQAASEASLRRRKVERKPAERLLIACEGEETEKRYFEAFIASLKISGIDVEICGEECDSAPISVVDFAASKARREGSAADGGYKRVFCVFDRDSHETYDQAVSKIASLNSNSRFPCKITAITSIPCFEFWILLHFQFRRAPFQGVRGKSVAHAVIKELKAIPGFAKYEKAISASQAQVLISKLEVAMKHAERCGEDVAKTSEPNPSTSVDKLVAYIRTRQKELEGEARKSF